MYATDDALLPACVTKQVTVAASSPQTNTDPTTPDEQIGEATSEPRTEVAGDELVADLEELDESSLDAALNDGGEIHGIVE